MNLLKSPNHKPQPAAAILALLYAIMALFCEQEKRPAYSPCVLLGREAPQHKVAFRRLLLEDRFSSTRSS